MDREKSRSKKSVFRPSTLSCLTLEIERICNSFAYLTRMAEPNNTIMTEEEYFRFRLKGCHVVCKDLRLRNSSLSRLIHRLSSFAMHSPRRLTLHRIFIQPSCLNERWPLTKIAESSRALPHIEDTPMRETIESGAKKPQCSLTAAPSLIRLSERFAVSRRRQ